MSNFNEAGAVVALFGLGIFVYSYLDRFIQTQADAVVSGIIRGVPAPLTHRRMMMVGRWFLLCYVQVMVQGLTALAWWILGKNTSLEEARMFCNLACFLFLGTAITWAVYVPWWYFRFSGYLRQAEAD